ncbi:MAG TPA: dienelactone hydrolase family protein [Candidatus Binatia bacterium]
MLLAGTATAETVQFRTASPSQNVNVTADFYRPSRNGPFPAIVVLHTCGGVGVKESQYASSLRGEGYVVVVPDSFASRGNRRKGYRCTPGNYENHVSDSVSDALGAAAYLRSLPFVRGDRIAVMGMSLGGTAVLALPPEALDQGIRAAISYYPPCVQADGKHFFNESKIPLLLLLAELDNWSPTTACVAKAQENQKSGRIVEWMVYPGAHHGFDNQSYYSAVNDNRGRTMQFNQSATDDSWNRFKTFLNKHLGKSPSLRGLPEFE